MIVSVTGIKLSLRQPQRLGPYTPGTELLFLDTQGTGGIYQGIIRAIGTHLQVELTTGEHWYITEQEVITCLS